TLSLNFARALAEVCMAGEESRWSLIPDLLTRSAHLGIGASALSSLVDTVVANWREWGCMLQIRTRDLPPFAELLAENPPRPKPGAVRKDTRVERPTVFFCSPGIEADEIAAMLTGLGRAPRLAATAEARAAAVAEPPELIVVDIDIPDVEFLNQCHALRQNPAGADTYLLIIASPNHEWAALRTIDAGADDVILKPVTLENLRLRLSMAERLRLLREGIRSERRGFVRSAEEFAGEHRQLIEVALTDPLTELPNRRHGLDYLAAETGSTRGRRSLACLMVDIDHFKAVNDEHGHAAGDAVLRQMAMRLKGASRLGDMVFRYGGEEFALLLPAADLALALRIAERIRSLVQEEAFIFEEQRLRITVSIGLAMLGEKNRNAEALIKAADAALYKAKRNGRNRVESAP
ncbi:MAG: GGDEF domain-containing protein, partial [Betaproteobacteria bacterium]